MIVMNRTLERVRRYAKDFIKAIGDGDYQASAGGILMPKKGLMITGTYLHGVNGKDWIEEQNLIPDAGILHVLGVVFKDTTRVTAWYIAPFSGTDTPAADWTGANFTSNSTEITSTTEGYSETYRQLFVPAAPATGAISNYASKAAFTIATATSVDINGAGMLSVQTRGGTTGTLASAIKFGATRTVQDADVWSCGYQIALSDS